MSSRDSVTSASSQDRQEKIFPNTDYPTDTAPPASAVRRKKRASGKTAGAGSAGASKKLTHGHFALATLPQIVLSYAYNERMVLADGRGTSVFLSFVRILNVCSVNSSSLIGGFL
jgi:hypothetical protein